MVFQETRLFSSMQPEWETGGSSCPVRYDLQYTHFMEIGQSKSGRDLHGGGVDVKLVSLRKLFMHRDRVACGREE